MTPRIACALPIVCTLAAPYTFAADIVLTPPAGSGVSMTNAAGNTTRFRVADDGSITLPGVAAVPVPATGLCVEIATGKVGTCSIAGGTVTAVGASAPLASSGGTTPNISLTGMIPVANGGTGATALTSNGVLYGQGTGALATAVGAAGQVLTGTAGAPAWTGSPSISGNLTLASSTASVGNILKGGIPFLHDYGNSNTFLGVNAGNLALSGSFNTAIGSQALMSNTQGSGNTASGQGALTKNTIGNGNTATGTTALAENTSGYFNTATGNEALLLNTTGNNNTATGAGALNQNTVGLFNTASGAVALNQNTSGNNNTATGLGALQFNVSGNDNTAVGMESLRFMNNSGNTAVGYHALVNSFGSDNVAIGKSASSANSGGNSNTVVGTSAGSSLTTGSNNIVVGASAGTNLTNGFNNIAIGHAGVLGDANTIRVGTTGTQTRAFVAGIRTVTTGVADAVAVLVDSTGQLGTTSSSARVKEDIADMGDATAALMKLRPVTFHYTQYGPQSRLQYGLVAEEVEQVYPGLVVRKDDGSAETVMYHFLPPMLLNELQKQQRMIEKQAQEIAELKRAMAEFVRQR